MAKRALDEMERLADFVRRDLDRLEREIARAREEEYRRERERYLRHKKARTQQCNVYKKTRICKFWQDRRCRDTRETCPYAHGEDDIKGALPIVRKTETHKQAAEFLASLHFAATFPVPQ